MSYGPALPPHLQKSRPVEDDPDQSSSSGDDDNDDNTLGPALPPHLQKKKKEASPQRDEEDDEEDALGPALPPGFKRASSGPKAAPMAKISKREEEDDDDDDDELIGPMPPISGKRSSGASSRTSLAAEFEARAQKMKDKLDGKADQAEPKRESWMTELPEDRSKNFGLGPRQFSKSTKDKAQRDHTWTKVPGSGNPDEDQSDDHDNKQDNPQEHDQDVLDYLASLKRDEHMEKVSKELKAKRGNKSLMDMHTKKRKKEAKAKKDEPQERRPFDRDIDLSANQFDNARKEVMMKKARQLDNRFSAGASKFL